MRRGIKEMDIILMRFAQARLTDLSAAQLDLYEAILDENDQDLYQWVTGQAAAPRPLAAMIAEIADLAHNGK